MRVVFFGTPELAVPSLAMLAERHEVAAVVCQPDRPQGRSSRLVAPPAKAFAVERGIPVAQPEKLNDGRFEAWLRGQAPDVCALAAYGRILKQPILDVPAQGFLNVHPSMLPRHRGPSPIQTAILEGDAVSGVTIMRLDAGMDTGDILLQREEAIRPKDTTASLSERLGRLGAELLIEGLALLAEGRAVFRPQEHRLATVSKIFDKAAGRIQWQQPARNIGNLIRAAIPWPVAHCLFEGQVCRIHEAEETAECGGAAPGVVTSVEKDRVVVATGKGHLALLAIQMPGKRVVTMAEFLRGHALGVGSRFESIHLEKELGVRS